jgi:hypothetical protein
VSITALLALFATDADWGAQAQYEDVEAKNRLAAAEAEKLGAKKIEAKLKIRKGTGSMGGGGGSDFGSGSGGGGSLYPEPPPRYAATPQAGSAGQTEFGRNTGPGSERSKQPAKPAKKRTPTEEELEAMLEASRQRSGSASSDD